MPASFVITDFTDNEHYDILGFYGNAFVNAISWLFTEDATHHEDYENYCLDGIIDMPGFVTIVCNFIRSALGKMPEQSLRDMLTRVKISHGANDIRYTKTEDGQPAWTIVTCNSEFMEAVLWSAYIFCRTGSMFSKDKYKRATPALIRALQKQMCLTDDGFQQSFLYRQINPTMRELLTYVEEETDQTESTAGQTPGDMAAAEQPGNKEAAADETPEMMLRVRIEAVLKMMEIKDANTVPNKAALCRVLALILNENASIIKATLYRRDSVTKKQLKLNKATHGNDIERYNQAIEDCNDKSLLIYKLTL